MEKLVKMILCLNHGQEDIERGFSGNKNLLKDNMKEASLISQCLICGHMTVKSIKPEMLVITKELLKSVKSARIFYDECLSNQKKEKNLSEGKAVRSHSRHREYQKNEVVTLLLKILKS